MMKQHADDIIRVFIVIFKQKMYGNIILADSTLKVPKRETCSFVLKNVALDLSSTLADLYIKSSSGNQVLVVNLDRSKSKTAYSLEIEFSPNQPAQLISKKGKVHIIGHYKQNAGKNQSMKKQAPTNAQIVPQKVQQKQEKKEPVRRSTRVRVPVANNKQEGSKKKKDTTLSNMAAYFKLDAKQLQQEDDDDEEAQFDDKDLNKSDQSSSSESQQQKDGEIEGQDKEIKESIRKRVKTDNQVSVTFSKPTKNPYDS